MVSVAVNPPKTPITKMTGDKAPATLPNVCKMPGPPAPFVPTPLPNCGQSMENPKKTTKKVTIEGQKVCVKGSYYMSKMIPSDMPSKPTGGGIITAAAGGKTKFAAPGSMNVKAEGKNIQLLGDAMTNNGGQGGNSGTVGNIQAATANQALVDEVGQDIADKLCTAACEAQKMKNEGKGSYHRQTDMRKIIDPKATRGANAVGGNTGILTEVGQAIQPGGMGNFIGKWGTAVAKKGFKVKWDIILTTATSTAKRTLKGGDVKKIVEVKFKNDTPTRAQKNAKAAMGKEAKEKFYEMDVEADCNCP